ncbi:MAG: hypothetical protein AB7J34_25615 [Limisphaerales bacterium]
MSDTVWSTSFEGDHLASVDVLITLGDGVLYVMSTIEEGSQLTAAQTDALLRLNFDMNYAKVGVDDDGDLIALNEAELRLIDAQALETIVNAVATVADDAAEALKSTTTSSIEDEVLTELGGIRLRRPAELRLLQGRATVRYESTSWRVMSEEELVGDQSPNQRQDTGFSRDGLAHADGDLWFMVVSERIEIPVEKMPDIGLQNARSMDPDVIVTRRGSRTVNGRRMLFQEMEGTFNGIPLTFVGHYYSSPIGTFQLLGWTGRNLIDEKRDELDQLVSGFTEH